ncbi:hypothetical protein LCGC14_2700890, partial [marine sediment metagenome]
FSIVMLTYWNYVSGYIVYVATLIEIGFHSDIIAIRYLTLSENPLGEQIFMVIGMFLFCSIPEWLSFSYQVFLTNEFI